MKIALALGGGGAKGAYEVGVIDALMKLGIKPSIITGTSIGSLNGSIYVQGDFEKLHDYNIFPQFDYKSLALDFDNIIKFSKDKEYDNKENAKPLKQVIDSFLDEERMRNSDIDFGLVCVSFPTMKPNELRLKDIKEGELSDYLLASSSIFPIFPMHKIDGKLHIDGGYYDNVPIDLAFSMGADYVVAVDLMLVPKYEKHLNSPLVKYIKPAHSLGPAFAFDKELIKNNIKLGYSDTLKAFDKALGFRYAFTKKSYKGHENLSHKFVKNIHVFESEIPRKMLRHTKWITMPKNIDIPLTKQIKMHTIRPLEAKDYFVRGAEICMEILNISPYKIYGIDNLNEVLIKRFLKKEKYEYSEIFNNIKSLPSGVDKEYLTGCILYRMIEMGFSDDIYLMSVIFPRETVAAFYLYTLIF